LWILAGATGTESLEDYVARDFDINDHVEFHFEPGEKGGQGLCLGNGARKTVEEKPSGAIGFPQTFFHDAHDQGIGDQIATFHASFNFFAELAVSLDGGAQDVAGGNLDGAVNGGQQPGHGPFSCAGGAQ
jgi:hypothetical protein